MTKETDEKKLHPLHPTRWIWILIGALIMGCISFGVIQLALKTTLVSSIKNPALQFWVFELGTGAGFLIGGFLVAVLSPGKTVREPMYAAMLAFAAQSTYLILSDIIVSLPTLTFFLMLALDGGLAWTGAWIGEKVTGATE